MALDGNAIGGLLTEIFAAEMTSAQTTCAACGAVGRWPTRWSTCAGPEQLSAAGDARAYSWLSPAYAD
jgi:hypothetical protein